MKKEDIIKSFESLLELTMATIFRDARVHAELGVLTWEESIEMITKAVNDSYTKFREMPDSEFVEEVICHLFELGDLAERLSNESNN